MWHIADDIDWKNMQTNMDCMSVDANIVTYYSIFHYEENSCLLCYCGCRGIELVVVFEGLEKGVNILNFKSSIKSSYYEHYHQCVIQKLRTKRQDKFLFGWKSFCVSIEHFTELLSSTQKTSKILTEVGLLGGMRSEFFQTKIILTSKQTGTLTFHTLLSLWFSR